MGKSYFFEILLNEGFPYTIKFRSRDNQFKASLDRDLLIEAIKE